MSAAARTHPLVQRLFEGDVSERALALRKELAETYENYLAEPSKRMRKALLAGVFFKAVAYIFKKRLPKDESPVVPLTRAERLFVDYGFLFPELIAEPAEKVEAHLESLRWNGGTSGHLRFHTHSGWLNEEYMKMMGHAERARMDDEIAILREQLKALSDEKERLKNEVFSLIAQAYATPEALSTRQTILSHTVNLYKLSEPLLQLKKRVQQGSALSGDERVALNTLEDRAGRLRRERNNMLRDTRVEHRIIIEITTNEERYLKKLDEHLTRWYEVERAERRKEEFIEAKAQTPRNLREEIIGAKVEELKNMLDFTARRSKVAPFPFLTRLPPSNLPELVLQTALECEKFDPELFKVKGIRLQGMPGVILAPGQGEGFYNFENHMFYIPLEFATKLEDSVIHALTIFKWDMDDSRELRDAFQELKPYKGKSFVELQQGLFREYHTWITKECRGYRVMDKELREWFQWKIAPKKDALERAAEAEGAPPVLETGRAVETLAEGTPGADGGEVAPTDGGAGAASGDGAATGLSETERGLGPEAESPDPGAVPAGPSPRPEARPPAGGAFPPFAPATAGATSEAARALEDLYERINKLLKWPDVRDRIMVRPSDTGGDIDLLIRGLSVGEVEAELLFNALLIQAKMRRLRGLERERWSLPAGDEPCGDA